MTTDVHFFPHWPANPYGQLLADAISNDEFNVVLREPKYYSNPAKTIGWAWSKRLVHFHWIDALYSGRTIPRFSIRMGVFLCTLVVLRLKGVKLVYTMHNLVPHEHRFSRLHQLANAFLVRVVHGVIAHNPQAAKRIREDYHVGEKVHVIEHIDYGEPLCGDPQGEARRELGLPIDRKLLLFFGAIRPYKGIEHLLGIADALDRMGVDLVIVGDPSDASAVSQCRKTALNQPNVHLALNRVDDLTLSRYLKAVDLVGLPYRAGLTSGAAHMALAHRRPIICSQCIAFDEFVHRGLAVSCDPASPDQLIAAVEQATSMDGQAYQSAVESYRKLCGAESVGSRHRKLYDRLQTESIPRFRALKQTPTATEGVT